MLERVISFPIGPWSWYYMASSSSSSSKSSSKSSKSSRRRSRIESRQLVHKKETEEDYLIMLATVAITYHATALPRNWDQQKACSAPSMPRVAERMVKEMKARGFLVRWLSLAGSCSDRGLVV
ncbi:hypothetical protein M406DRAFT_327398 [Cryphonectria parasitica EP155]|uniref:Uncharacterized protein n=1 Tax=Cryphonectria parasitica (strain ATCC 38755 / EP155) TaxID=660469 RepID=A0A9P4Y9Q6_CRYP1|nr:uncharacterized protein M406DRAFT_327398 [Cryphonectria parasitica EP155]KAF3768989.1 hypothetical protein M406DRAFT_327398 [Cryphonectria parasitica EP155]